MKAVRTDRELECPAVDAGLRARCVDPPQRTDIQAIGSYGFFGA